MTAQTSRRRFLKWTSAAVAALAASAGGLCLWPRGGRRRRRLPVSLLLQRAAIVLGPWSSAAEARAQADDFLARFVSESSCARESYRSTLEKLTDVEDGTIDLRQFSQSELSVLATLIARMYYSVEIGALVTGLPGSAVCAGPTQYTERPRAEPPHRADRR